MENEHFLAASEIYPANEDEHFLDASECFQPMKTSFPIK